MLFVLSIIIIITLCKYMAWPRRNCNYFFPVALTRSRQELQHFRHCINVTYIVTLYIICIVIIGAAIFSRDNGVISYLNFASSFEWNIFR